MKMIIPLMVGALACVANAAFAEEVALDTEQRKSSYAMGLQIVENLRKANLDVDQPSFALGINDALAQRESRLSKDEIKAANDWQQGELRKRLEAKAAENLAAGQAFLEENKTKEGVITLASGLQYQVIEAGTGAVKPKPTDSVTVRFWGAHINGERFDSSEKRGKPVDLEIDKLNKGWQEALQLMTVGSKWQIFVPASLAYAETGSIDGKVGANEALMYEVELLSIADAKSEPAVRPTFRKTPKAGETKKN